MTSSRKRHPAKRKTLKRKAVALKLKLLLNPESIQRRIYLVRSEKVMLSTDLAELYQVEARVLMQAVKRNMERFPDDFMFQLSEQEGDSLRSQFVILDRGRGQHAKYAPYAFTEQGVAMLASVLRSQVAVDASLNIIRAFVRFRAIVSGQKELARKVDALERRQQEQGFRIDCIIDSIHSLRQAKDSKRKRIGFTGPQE